MDNVNSLVQDEPQTNPNVLKKKERTGTTEPVKESNEGSANEDRQRRGIILYFKGNKAYVIYKNVIYAIDKTPNMKIGYKVRF